MDTSGPSINLEALEDDTAEVKSFFAPGRAHRLHVGPALQQRLDLIDHLLEFGRQIVVLSGPSGSGKSAILDHVAGAKRANWCLVRLAANSDTDERALLEVLIHAMDIPLTEAEGVSPLDMARVGIEALQRTGRVVVLMVDDAENLQASAVGALTRMAHSTEGRAELKVLLAADLDRGPLLETLQRADPQTGLVHIVEIPRLLEGQIQEFIEHCLLSSDHASVDALTEDDYERIATLTDGLPANVLELARQTLVERERMQHVPPPPPRTSGGGIKRAQINLIFAALAVIALGGGAWWANQRPLEAPTGTETVELAPPEPTVPALPTAADVAPLEGLAPGTELAAPTDPSVPTPLPPAGETATTAVEDASVPAVAVASTADETLPPGVELAETPEPAPPAVAATPEPTATVAEPVVAVPPPAAPAPAEPVAAAPAPVPPPTPAAPERAPAPVAATPAPAPTQSTQGTSARGLMGKPGTTHTLQLLGLSTRARAEAFCRERGISARSEILESRLNGKPLFLVVYGAYSSRAAAQAALKALPGSLSDTRPWARSVSSLRGVVR